MKYNTNKETVESCPVMSTPTIKDDQGQQSQQEQWMQTDAHVNKWLDDSDSD